MRNVLLFVLATVAILMMAGCWDGEIRAEHPLPVADLPTPAQAALEHQLADERDRVLKLEQALGAPAKTLAQQAARVTAAELLVKQVRDAAVDAVRDATVQGRAAQKAESQLEMQAAAKVLMDERDKYRAEAAEAKQHAARMAELILASLAVISALLAYWLAGERKKLLGFSGACLGVAAAVVFIEAILPYVVYIVWAFVVGGIAWLARKHISLRSMAVEIAKCHPARPFAYLEGEARIAWAWLVSEAHGSKVAASLSKITKTEFVQAETEARAFLDKAKGMVGSTSHTVVSAPMTMQQDVDVVKFGADPNGIADSSQAFSNAAASIQPAGGRLVASNGGTFKISAGMLLPGNVSIFGVKIIH